MTVLPRYLEGNEGLYHSDPESQHKDIRRDDGMSFLAIYRPGARAYVTELNDPFFAAHNNASSHRASSFYADREATALCCVEQFQYCTRNGGFCSACAKGTQELGKIAKHPSVVEDLPTFSELLVSFRMLPAYIGVYGYLTTAIEWHSMVPLSRSNPWIHMKSVSFNSSIDHWAAEVESWFNKASFHGLLQVRNGMRISSKGWAKSADMNYKREYALCGRILFPSDNHTNINFIGFCSTTGAAALVCVLSCSIESICLALTSLSKSINHRLSTKTVLTQMIMNGTWCTGAGHFWSQIDFIQRFSRIRKGSSMKSSGTSTRRTDPPHVELGAVP
jgi:hypothetical protein